VAARGTSELNWLVRYNDGWVHVSEWPGAEIERQQTRSGVIWENLTRLRVLSGTRLTRVESRPAPYPKRDALDYLGKSVQAGRRVSRQEFRVGARGELLRAT
jgi:hypothetical protein